MPEKQQLSRSYLIHRNKTCELALYNSYIADSERVTHANSELAYMLNPHKKDKNVFSWKTNQNTMETVKKAYVHILRKIEKASVSTVVMVVKKGWLLLLWFVRLFLVLFLCFHATTHSKFNRMDEYAYDENFVDILTLKRFLSPHDFLQLVKYHTMYLQKSIKSNGNSAQKIQFNRGNLIHPHILFYMYWKWIRRGISHRELCVNCEQRIQYVAHK